LSAKNLYWSNSPPSGGAVMKVALDGTGGPHPIVTYDNETPWSIAVDKTNVYWRTSSGSVMKAPLDGGNPVKLSSDFGVGIAVDATRVYWTNETNNTVKKMPIDGGGVATVIASDQDEPGILVVDGSALYWANRAAIMKANLDGSGPSILASDQPGAGAIVVDATSVYWTTYRKDGPVMKVTPK
jgi:hypothetical protein